MKLSIVCDFLERFSGAVGRHEYRDSQRWPSWAHKALQGEIGTAIVLGWPDPKKHGPSCW